MLPTKQVYHPILYVDTTGPFHYFHVVGMCMYLQLRIEFI